MLAQVLVGAAIAWPLIGAAALWQRGEAEPVWVSVVYTAAGQVCHQRTERSFHTHGAAWPVCARCSGLYLAAPFAAIAAFRRRKQPHDPLRLVILAAVPTALTLAWEWGGLGTPSNAWRFITALPLGAAVAFVLVEAVNAGKLTSHGRAPETHQ